MEDILWLSHGGQEKKKSWFMFPFKSLTFYAPNDTLLRHSNSNVKETLNIACKNEKVNKWIKEPVMDVLNEKYLNKNYELKLKYSYKKLKTIWEKLEEEKSKNIKLNELVQELGVFDEQDINYIDYTHITKIINLFSGNDKSIIENLFGINKQTQLINLRNMELGIQDDVFNDIYGIWKCTNKNEPELLYNLKDKSKNKEGMNLVDAFQLLEDTLIDKKINPSECNIKMLCCRSDMYTTISKEEIEWMPRYGDWVYGSNSSGKRFNATYFGTNNPTTYTKKSEALNAEIILLSEENLGLYLENKSNVLPDLEDKETNQSCNSYGNQPTKCDEKNNFRKQALLFHPDNNYTCKNSATKKFFELTKLCKNVDPIKNSNLSIGGAKSKKSKKSKKNKRKNKRKTKRKK